MFWFSMRRNRTRRAVTQQTVSPSSDLWDLVLDMDWDRALAHAKEHPTDAEWMDGHWHETPLYLACQHNPPLEVIRAIVKAYPRALLSPSRANKDLPIHIACRYQVSNEIIFELLKDFPVTAVEQTRWGRTPVMALWEFRPIEEGSSTSTCLDEALWEKMLVVLEAVARFRELPAYRYQKPRTRKREFRGRACAGTERSIIWQTDDPNENLFIVHAAVSLGALSCPVEVLEYALQQFPEQAFCRDQWGQLPLHIAVGPTAWNATTRRRYKPREQEFISRLLAANPDAANETTQGDHGRRPLHIAISNRHTWSGGIECLFRAAPEVLLTPDPVTRLYPFQLASVPVRDNQVDLDTIYMLLRSQPDVLGLMDFRVRPRRSSRHWSRAKASTRGLDLVCPRGFQDVILGTAAAVSIGGIAGLVFGR